MLSKLKNNRVFKITLIVVIGLGIFLLGFGTAVKYDHSDTLLGRAVTKLQFGQAVPSNIDFNLFWDVWTKVHANYVGQIDDQQLVYGAIKGMVGGMGDPYTVFFDPAEAKLFNEDVEGEFSGIGIEIGMKNNVLTVIAPLDGSPAEKAGLKSGDSVLKIEDKDTTGMTINEAISRIRGPKGTIIHLTIMPKDGSDSKDIAVTRDTITVPSVKEEVKSNNIGYIRITQFANDTADKVVAAARDLKSKNVAGIILDLRDNPGGYLNSAQSVSSVFLSSGVVMMEEDKDGHRTNLSTNMDPILPDPPLVVLVNGGSASAAEITAGAIQDHHRGTLVGEKTFGKGSVQTVEDLSDGSTLKVTVAKWLTPSGRQINGQGIAPDVEVKISDADVTAGRDPQMNKAIEILSSKK